MTADQLDNRRFMSPDVLGVLAVNLAAGAVGARHYIIDKWPWREQVFKAPLRSCGITAYACCRVRRQCAGRVGAHAPAATHLKRQKIILT
jgi:hypothetical protein